MENRNIIQYLSLCILLIASLQVTESKSVSRRSAAAAGSGTVYGAAPAATKGHFASVAVENTEGDTEFRKKREAEPEEEEAETENTEEETEGETENTEEDTGAAGGGAGSATDCGAAPAITNGRYASVAVDTAEGDAENTEEETETENTEAEEGETEEEEEARKKREAEPEEEEAETENTEEEAEGEDSGAESTEEDAGSEDLSAATTLEIICDDGFEIAEDLSIQECIDTAWTMLEPVCDVAGSKGGKARMNDDTANSTATENNDSGCATLGVMTGHVVLLAVTSTVLATILYH